MFNFVQVQGGRKYSATAWLRAKFEPDTEVGWKGRFAKENFISWCLYKFLFLWSKQGGDEI